MLKTMIAANYFTLTILSLVIAMLLFCFICGICYIIGYFINKTTKPMAVKRSSKHIFFERAFGCAIAVLYLSCIFHIAGYFIKQHIVKEQNKRLVLTTHDFLYLRNICSQIRCRKNVTVLNKIN
jgi:hypothetical protein